VARKTVVEQLKRSHSRRLLKMPGVNGVGVERGEHREDYVLVVHVSDDDETTRAAVLREVGPEAVRIVKSGPFRKQ
jgi:hypothetical protein